MGFAQCCIRAPQPQEPPPPARESGYETKYLPSVVAISPDMRHLIDNYPSSEPGVQEGRKASSPARTSAQTSSAQPCAQPDCLLANREVSRKMAAFTFLLSSRGSIETAASCTSHRDNGIRTWLLTAGWHGTSQRISRTVVARHRTSSTKLTPPTIVLDDQTPHTCRQATDEVGATCILCLASIRGRDAVLFAWSTEQTWCACWRPTGCVRVERQLARP